MSAPARRGEAPGFAVLPFDNLSGVADDDVLASGMTEDLIDALSCIGTLRVITGSVTARFTAGKAHDLKAAARDLRFRYLMQGNVRRIGDTLRVTAQLVEAASGEVLWTQRFARPLHELAALQEDLAAEVAAHLGSQVDRAEMSRVLRKPDDLTAWECVMRATAAYRQVVPASMMRASEEARRAVELAPDYGLAHAMQADADAAAYYWNDPDDPGKVAAISASIARAIDLDPDNPLVLAHVADAYDYLGLPRDALAPGERAASLNPNLALAHFALGVANGLLDRRDESDRHFDAEMKVAPGLHTLFASWAWRGNTAIRVGDWAAAEHYHRRVLELNLASVSGHFGLAIGARQLGRHDEARASMTRVRQIAPEMTQADWQRHRRRSLKDSPVLDIVLDHLGHLWADTDTTVTRGN